MCFGWAAQGYASPIRTESHRVIRSRWRISSWQIANIVVGVVVQRVKRNKNKNVFMLKRSIDCTIWTLSAGHPLPAARVKP